MRLNVLSWVSQALWTAWCRAFVNKEMNVWIPWRTRGTWLAELSSASQGGLCRSESVVCRITLLRVRYSLFQLILCYLLTHSLNYSLIQLLTHFFTYLLTYSIQQSPSSEANRFSASQEIPRILWNPKVHYLSHKCPPPIPILSQVDPVHTPTSHFLKIHLNIIFPSTPGSLKCSDSGFPPEHCIRLFSSLPHTRYTPRPSHSSRFYHPNNIW